MKSFLKLCVTVFVVVLGVSLVAAGGKGASHLKITVVKSVNGKPVRNAHVVLHPVDKQGNQQRGGLQLKTDMEGNASIEGIPYGKLRVQIIAEGFQTYGQDYDVNQPLHEWTIKLERPKEQISIYK